MFTRDKSQLLNEEHSGMGNNTYFCYNPKNKEASLSNVSQYFIQMANRSGKLHTCKTWHAVQKTMLKSPIPELLPSLKTVSQKLNCSIEHHGSDNT